MSQEDFSLLMEKAYQEALKSAETIVENARHIQKQAESELDTAKEFRKKSEQEGETMARAYFENCQKQFSEAAKTELLRNLARMHLEVGKTPREIAVWLDVSLEFVEKIRDLITRNLAFNKHKRLKIEGNPKVSYVTKGRGGHIVFESRETTFELWWEFAGGSALALVEIPSKESWEKRTNLPLERRDSVLTFIAEQVVEDKISGEGSFIIGEDVITFYGASKYDDR